MKQLKLLQNSQTQIVTKLTNSICDKTQIVTQLKTVVMVTVMTVVTKKIKSQLFFLLKKLKLLPNLKTQILTRLKKTNCDKTQKLKL